MLDDTLEDVKYLNLNQGRIMLGQSSLPRILVLSKVKISLKEREI